MTYEEFLNIPVSVLRDLETILKHFREICEHFPTDWGHLTNWNTST